MGKKLTPNPRQHAVRWVPWDWVKVGVQHGYAFFIGEMQWADDAQGVSDMGGINQSLLEHGITAGLYIGRGLTHPDKPTSIFCCHTQSD